jgi:hypothetical protein
VAGKRADEVLLHYGESRRSHFHNVPASLRLLLLPIGTTAATTTATTTVIIMLREA